MTITPRTAEELLRDIDVLGALPNSDTVALAEAAEVRQAARGAPLFQEGQLAEGLFIVRTGEVKLVKGARDGREQILYLARSGRPITEGVRFDQGPYPATAVAMRATSALLIHNQALWGLGSQRPGVLGALIDLKARRVDRLLTLIRDLSLRTVPARLASFLCDLVEQRTARGEDATTLVRDLTTETVAGRLGTVREEISRGLAALERAGAVQVSPEAVVVKDLDQLRAIALANRRG